MINKERDTILNKSDVISCVKEFLAHTGLTMDDISVGFGACAVMMGIRTNTADVDMDVPIGFYNQCVDSGFEEYDSIVGKCIKYSDLIDIRANRAPSTTFVDGVRCHTSKHALTEKLAAVKHPDRPYLKRVQDRADIKGFRRLIAAQQYLM